MRGDIRFRIDSLIAIAKSTTDDELRERLLAEAVELLDFTDDQEDGQKKEFDSVKSFVDDIVIYKPRSKVRRADVYDRYYKYCFDNRYIAISRGKFYTHMRALGFPTFRGSSTRSLMNLELPKE